MTRFLVKIFYWIQNEGINHKNLKQVKYSRSHISIKLVNSNWQLKFKRFPFKSIINQVHMAFMLHQIVTHVGSSMVLVQMNHSSNLATTMQQIWFGNVPLACEVLLYTDSHCSSRQLSSQLRNINNQEKVSVKYWIFSYRLNSTEYKNIDTRTDS